MQGRTAGNSLLTSGEDKWIYKTSIDAPGSSCWKCQGVNELTVLSHNRVALLPYGENEVRLHCSACEWPEGLGR